MQPSDVSYPQAGVTDGAYGQSAGGEPVAECLRLHSIARAKYRAYLVAKSEYLSAAHAAQLFTRDHHNKAAA